MDRNKVERLVISARNRLVDVIFSKHKQEELTKINEELHEALDELQKPDWISVEDELPPIGERVWVCNIKNPDVVVLDYRSDIHNCKVNDGYGFLIGNHATHWRKIDKLEV